MTTTKRLLPTALGFAIVVMAAMLTISCGRESGGHDGESAHAHEAAEAAGHEGHDDHDEGKLVKLSAEDLRGRDRRSGNTRGDGEITG
jgi:hypothetical protein